jgi:hypothetical protein
MRRAPNTDALLIVTTMSVPERRHWDALSRSRITRGTVARTPNALGRSGVSARGTK